MPSRPKKIKYIYKAGKKRGATTPCFDLENLVFQNIHSQFSKNIERLGYNQRSQTMIPSCVKEFLYKMEEKGIRSFKEISPADIKEHHQYLNQRPNFVQKKSGLSSTMITHHMYSLRLFFTYLEEVKLITKNPISALTFPKAETKEREILTLEEIKELYSVAETLKDKAILGIFYGCGLRREEGVQLNIRDLNFRNKILYVREGKGKKRRVVPIGITVAQDLRNYYLNERGIYVRKKTKDNQQAFLLNHEGNRMSGNSINNRLKQLFLLTCNPEFLRKEITLHNLRHSIATHLLDNGLSIESVRQYLGHEHLESTQLYTKVSKTLLQQL